MTMLGGRNLDQQDVGGEQQNQQSQRPAASAPVPTQEAEITPTQSEDETDDLPF